MDDVAHFYAKDRKSWRAWLEKNHANENAVWLVFDKGQHRTISWQDIVQEALCYGWIDGRARKVSDTQAKIYVSRRKPKSIWSRINKQNVEKLIEENLMQPAGLASIETAKLNGSWNALDLSDNLIKPPGLQELFEKNDTAKTNFEGFPVSAKKNALWWIYDAKTEATKRKRIKLIFDAAKENIRLR